MFSLHTQKTSLLCNSQLHVDSSLICSLHLLVHSFSYQPNVYMNDNVNSTYQRWHFPVFRVPGYIKLARGPMRLRIPMFGLGCRAWRNRWREEVRKAAGSLISHWTIAYNTKTKQYLDLQHKSISYHHRNESVKNTVITSKH